MEKLKYIISDKDEDSVVYLNVDEISCSYQRKCCNEDITDLASSIKQSGVIAPVIVRRNGEKYDLIAGWLRLKAVKLSGITSIPAIVHDSNNR